MASDDLELAHEHAFSNRSEVQGSEICGCFGCERIFPPSDIVDWTEESEPPLFVDNVLVARRKVEPSALCPKCGIDSVIGSCSSYPITIEFLKRMRQRWFERS